MISNELRLSSHIEINIKLYLYFSLDIINQVLNKKKKINKRSNKFLHKFKSIIYVYNLSCQLLQRNQRNLLKSMQRMLKPNICRLVFQYVKQVCMFIRLDGEILFSYVLNLV